mgnify:CR=1 FL=1
MILLCDLRLVICLLLVLLVSASDSLHARWSMPGPSITRTKGKVGGWVVVRGGGSGGEEQKEDNKDIKGDAIDAFQGDSIDVDDGDNQVFDSSSDDEGEEEEEERNEKEEEKQDESEFDNENENENDSEEAKKKVDMAVNTEGEGGNEDPSDHQPREGSDHADPDSSDSDSADSDSASIAPDCSDSSVVINTQSSVSGGQNLQSSLLLAVSLRSDGKEYHDQANFPLAAETFKKAGDILLPHLSQIENGDSSVGGDSDSDSKSENNGSVLTDCNLDEALLEFATNRIHQSLCLSKLSSFPSAVDACNSVINLSPGFSRRLPPSVLGRAYHRRGKAREGEGDKGRAREDARRGGELGDQLASKMYGRLVREEGGVAAGNAAGGTVANTSSESSQTDSSFQGGNDFFSSLSSLASPSMSSPTASAAGETNDSSPLLSALTKKLLLTLSLPSTQKTLHTFLTSLTPGSAQTLASALGINLGEERTGAIVKRCNNVTEEGIRKSVKILSITVRVAQVAKKVAKFIEEYKHVIVAYVLWRWIKAAGKVKEAK